jgi:CHAT domain-containing protein
MRNLYFFTALLLCTLAHISVVGQSPADCAVRINSLREAYWQGLAPAQVSTRCQALEKNCSLNNHSEQKADLYTIWGNALLDMGTPAAWQSAKEKHSIALACRQQYFGLQSEAAARSWSNLGNAYMALHDYPAAKNAFFTAWQIDSLVLPDSDPRLLPVVQNIGQFFYQTNHLYQALEWWQKGLKIAQKSKNPVQNLSFLKGLGDVFMRLSDASQAIHYFRQAQAIQADVPLLLSLSLALEKSGDIRQALLVVEEALVIPEQRHTSAIAQNHARLLLAQGRLQHRAKKQTNPMAVCAKIAAIMHHWPPAERAAIEWQMGNLCFQAGNLRQAEQYYTTALRDVPLHDSLLRVQLWQQKTTIALHQKKDAEALACAEAALQWLPNNGVEPLHLAVTALACRSIRRQGGGASSTRVIQLTQQMFQRLDRQGSYRSSGDAALQWQQQLQPLYACAAEAYLSLKDTVRAFEVADAAKTTIFQSFSGQKPVFLPKNAHFLQQWLPDKKGKTTISYVCTPEKLLVFVLRHSGLSAWQIPCDTALMRPRIEQFFIQCSTAPRYQGSNRALASKELLSNGTWLFDYLLRPFLQAEDLFLTIIPDGILHYVPFEALVLQQHTDPEQMDRHTWLIQHYSIRYAASVAEDAVAPARTRMNRKELLIMAPLFQQSAAGFRPLPGSYWEALSLDSIINNADLYQGTAATRTRFLASAEQYSVVHLCTHGVADGHNPAYSFIAFSDDSTGSDRLFANEITGLSLHNTQMIVLSACQTQFGHLSEGTGLLSLAWAFRQAGVPCLTASLWNVADVRSGLIQRVFYHYLHQCWDKDVALTEARRQYIQDSDRETAHPFYWAGIRIMGEEAPLPFSRFPSFNTLAAIILMAGALLLAWYFYRRNE